MGVMKKMRQGTGVILWVLIISFGLLWVLADTQFFDAVMQGPRTLGSVNDEAIALEEYNNRVSYFVEQYSRQTGNSVTPEIRANYEQQAWNDLVTTKLLEQKMEELGIEVTDQEVVEMITGDNPAPFIRQQFAKEDGTIDRVALQSAIEAPENTQLWVSIEQQLRQSRRQQKMSNYLQSSMQVSSYEVEEQYIRNNTNADVSFVRFPYADISEEEVTVTESDLKTYYQNHQDQFQRDRSYRFDYVSYDKSPTAADTARTIRTMENLRSDFANAENDSLFLNRYQSTTPFSAEMVNKENVRELFTPVLDLENDEVTKVINDQGRVYLLKKLDETQNKVQFVVFSNDVRADPVATIDEQAEAADDFSFYAEQEGFQTEAERRELEVKEAFATKGNNFISGIGQSSQIMNFLNNAEEGDISDPIELSGQIVVMHVTEVTAEGVRPFEEVESQIRTTVTNQKRRQQMLNRVQELAGQYSDLQALAEATGKEVQSVEGLNMSSNTIPGAGREPKVVGAIFNLEEGEQSAPVEGTSAVVIARLDQLQEASLDNITESDRQQIRQKLQQQKASVFMNTWIQQLKEEAEIEDNRADVLQG